MSAELDLLKEISKKLDQMILLSKLSKRNTLEELEEKIRGDKVSKKLLDFSDGSLTTSQLIQKVVKKLGAKKRTVERKISDLKKNGFLIARKEGREIYYEKSDLFD